MRMRARLAYRVVWDRFPSTALMLMLALTLALAGATLMAPRAHAGADTATLKITNSPPFVYGSSSISVQMIVTLATALSDPTLAQQTQHVQVSNGSSWGLGWASTSADGLTLTYNGAISPSENNLVPPGSYTATASFVNPDTHVTTPSNPVSFTVAKMPGAISCYITGGTGGIIAVGQTLYINLSSGVNGSAQPGDTVTVTLTGPQDISATLQADQNGNVHMAAPTLPGTYAVTCEFAGNAYYNPATATTTLDVHDDAHVAGMKLYTSPTTVIHGNMTFYIVLLPKSGYPAPTGYLTIVMGNYQYSAIPVGANGATLVELESVPAISGNPFSKITIDYGGDSRYLNSTFNFPLTNPAIPGSAPRSGTTTSGKSGKSSGASATPTAKVGAPTPTATVAATATVAPTPTPVATIRPSAASALVNLDNTPLPWLAGGLAALLILGGLISGLASVRHQHAPDAPAPEPVAVADVGPSATTEPDPSL